MSAQRYLEIERAASEKSQYYRGEMFAMAGASARHNLIVANVIGELRNALRETPCHVFASDLRVALDPADHYVYPDAVVLCGQGEYIDEASDTLTNPTVIVEVLSESTERDDRGLKFSSYRSLPSVQAVLFVSQDRRLVEVYARHCGDQWLLKAYDSPEAQTITIPHLNVELRLDDLYRGVDFSTAASHLSR